MTTDSATARKPLPTESDPAKSGYDDAYDGMTVIVCSSCRHLGEADVSPRPGSLLAADTARAAQADGIRVQSVACLGNCKRGLSAAILRQGAWSYIFGELTTQSGEDLIAGAKLFAEAEDGFMPFRARPQALKRGLVARIPTFESLKDLP